MQRPDAPSPHSPAPEPTTNVAKVLRLPDVCKTTGLCRSMIYRMESENRFPQRIRLSLRAVGWLAAEVQAWVATRTRGTTANGRVTVEILRANKS